MLIKSTSGRLLAGVDRADRSANPVAIANADPWGEEPDRCRTGA